MVRVRIKLHSRRQSCCTVAVVVQEFVFRTSHRWTAEATTRQYFGLGFQRIQQNAHGCTSPVLRKL
ncbi:unnamed protein product [Chondrus crispus]|uniref:Uncharacterized protein n=1 Tax=Chondrus crispus TaxID=2769 RepID=R7Q5U8_CHOCR|nr:unnamed protein product [Chondrus crispus]CDF32756.1 unnamed protein product [Chondrus crispus]|eukprot:XP_005712557.1 unnamed protein product [Chondrus crispus]